MSTYRCQKRTSNKVHLFLSCCIHNSYTPKSSALKKDRSDCWRAAWNTFVWLHHIFQVFWTVARGLSIGQTVMYWWKGRNNSQETQIVQTTRETCFEELGGSLWIIKSFYRNSETVNKVGAGNLISRFHACACSHRNLSKGPTCNCRSQIWMFSATLCCACFSFEENKDQVIWKFYCSTLLSLKCF